jgi:hypothetical protein
MPETESSRDLPLRASDAGWTWNWLTVIATLLGFVTGTAAFVTNLHTIVDGARWACQEIGACAAPALQVPDRTAGAARIEPEPAPVPRPARRPGPGPGHGAYVVLGADAAAPLAARLRRTLDLEGIELAADPAAAAQRVELAPPLVGAAQPAPAGGPALYGVIVTLEARIFGPGAGTPPITVVQRQARGFGETPAEARDRAQANAADLLGRRLAEALR